MTVFNVSSAKQLQSVLSLAKGGDTVLLAGGNYGDFSATSLKYSSNVTIQSASQSNPAVFNSFHITSSQNIAVNDVNVHMAPTATSVAWAAAVGIYNSTGITWANSTITGGPAVNGVPQTATALDATGNVVGLPTGQGVTVVGSSGVSLVGNTFSALDKGINLSDSSQVTVSDNQFSDTRHGAVGGSDISDVAITNNHISDSNPWAWGQPYGDHADFIHIWTSPPAQTSPSSNISITGNVISQGDGQPIMGINFEAKTPAGSSTPLGFTGVDISDNAIILGNAQGMRLSGFDHSTVSDNTLIQPASGGVATPGILFAGGATDTTVTGNIAGAIYDQGGSPTNTVSDNHTAQNVDQGGAAYFDPSLATQAEKTGDPSAIRDIIQSALPETTTASVYQNTAANIVANLATLAGSSAISKIVITDNAPITLTVAQWANNGQVLGELVNQNGSHYTFVIKDAGKNLAAALDTLNSQTWLKSIVVSDNQALWLNAAQAAKDASAMAKLVNANGAAVQIAVSDTGANITAMLHGLEANADKLLSVSVTDKGAITLSASQFVDDVSFLNKIRSVGAYNIRDTAANIDSRLDQLSAMQKMAGAHFSSLVVTDGQPIRVSFAELIADANAIRMLTNPDGTPVKVTVVDTGATILANLNTLTWTANIGSIVISDGATLTLTALMKAGNVATLAKLVYDDGGVCDVLTGSTSYASKGLPSSPVLTAPVSEPAGYSGSAADISLKLDTLNGSQQTITITDNQALKVSVTQALNDGQALSHLVNANGGAAVVNVTDTAANIAANLHALAAVHALGAITVSDGKAIGMSIAQLKAEAAAVGHLAAGSIAVTDTAANVAANLKALGADSHVGSITVADNTMVRVTAADFDAGQAGLAKIGGRHIVNEINIQGHDYVSELYTYNDAGILTSNTFIAADGSRTVEAHTGGQTFSSQPFEQTIHATHEGSDLFVFMSNFGSETLYGFDVGTDHMSFQRSMFSSTTDVMAKAHDDGHGAVVFDVAAGQTITVMGTSVAQLAAQKDLFHFF